MNIVTDIILPALATIITGLASWGASALVAWLNSKIKNANLQAALETAQNIVTATVYEVTQTYVDSLKKAGKFDAEAQETAFKMAYNTIIEQLTDKQKTALQSVCTDVEAYIKTLIESTVKLTKEA